jgi:hypothetical protein
MVAWRYYTLPRPYPEEKLQISDLSSLTVLQAALTIEGAKLANKRIFTLTASISVNF